MDEKNWPFGYIQYFLVHEGETMSNLLNLMSVCYFHSDSTMICGMILILFEIGQW